MSECFKKYNTSNLTFYNNCSNQTYTTQIKIRKCLGSDDKLINKCSEQEDLKKPSLSNGKCINLVKSVIFILNYRPQEGIVDTAIDVSFVDADVNDSKSVEQNFKVYFTESDLVILKYY